MKPQTFASFDDYAAALQHASFRVTALGPARKPWTVNYLQLDRVSVQWGEDGGPIGFEGALGDPGILFFMGRHAPHKLIGNGVVLDDAALMILPLNAEFCTVAIDAATWISAFVPLDAIGGAHPLGLSCRTISPATVESTRVRAALLRIVNAAEHDAFEQGQTPRVAAAQELIGCTVELMRALRSDDSEQCVGRHLIPRAEILRRAERLLKQSRGESITLEDLASVTDVSQRTLHNAFHEQFGVSPKRYLRLRTLNEARRNLRRADARVTRVTDVAARLGIWEWGRFSHDYHTLFGELPSQTLRRMHSAVCPA